MTKWRSGSLCAGISINILVLTLFWLENACIIQLKRIFSVKVNDLGENPILKLSKFSIIPWIESWILDINVSESVLGLVHTQWGPLFSWLFRLAEASHGPEFNNFMPTLLLVAHRALQKLSYQDFTRRSKWDHFLCFFIFFPRHFLRKHMNYESWAQEGRRSNHNDTHAVIGRHLQLTVQYLSLAYQMVLERE